MGYGKEKNVSNSTAWVGKHRILVKSRTNLIRSEWFVADLKENMIVMKHPQIVWSDNFFGFESKAVLHNDTLSVINIGVHNYTNTAPLLCRYPRPIKTLNKEKDYIHSSDLDTCVISTLDLTKNPPLWSNWTPGPKMILKRQFPLCATLDNNIFAFRGAVYDFKNPEVYRIGSSDVDDDDKWEEITFPSTPYDPEVPFLVIQPISDPKYKRLIAYFCCKGNGSLYAYYPHNKTWTLFHQKLSEEDLFLDASAVADQVVGDGRLILCFYSSHDQNFKAYNICSNKWLKVDFQCLFQFDHPRKMYFGTESKLVHLGNDILCLAYSYSKSLDDTVIQFLRFSVKLAEEEEEEELVQLTPLSFHTVSIDNIHSRVDTFIPF